MVLGKPSEVGDAVTLPLEAVVPVPENVTTRGMLDLSAMVIFAERDPVALGLNVIEMLHVAAGASVDPHVLLETTKSEAFVPLSVGPTIGTLALVPLVIVALCAELLEPTFTEPNESEVGLIVTKPLVPPGAKPDNETVWGELVAESLKLSVAVRVPATVGAKATFAVQLAPAARLDPHVLP